MEEFEVEDQQQKVIVCLPTGDALGFFLLAFLIEAPHGYSGKLIAPAPPLVVAVNCCNHTLQQDFIQSLTEARGRSQAHQIRYYKLPKESNSHRLINKLTTRIKQIGNAVISLFFPLLLWGYILLMDSMLEKKMIQQYLQHSQMRKLSQFDQIYSEEDVDFNHSASKFSIKREKTTLQKLVNEGTKLSSIAKNILTEGKAEQIKKRKSEAETAPEMKLVSYRQRSKMRYGSSVPQKDTNNDQITSEEQNIFQSRNTGEELSSDAMDPKSSNSTNHKLENNALMHPQKHQKIINESNLPKLSSKTQELYNIYGGGKKPLSKLRQNEPQKKSNLGRDAKDRASRMQKLQRAKQILSGKLSIVWIFAISTQIDEELKDRIFQVYRALIDDSNVVPFVRNAWEIEPFLNLPNAYFKIVANIGNIQGALRYKINVRVVEYYIYNDQGETGTSKALQLKGWSKKVKGIYTDLEKIIEKTEEQIEDTIQIYKINNGFEANIKQKKFPNFLKLSGRDKTEATLYRANLYGSIKLSEEDRKVDYEYFLMLVRQKYGKIQKQQSNISDYTKIRHLIQILSAEQARQIIQFYVRESFYYQIVNSMLRTLKTTEQFKPCILPFNEIYHSIKKFYGSYLKQIKNDLPGMTLYRGAKVKKRDFRLLQQGDFLQMFGFMSTSKSRASAQKFTDNDGYLFVIHVKARNMSPKFQRYDHGFVDINKYGLAGKKFESEEEVLFNALNIYKVSKIEDDGRNILIHLEYGAIFDLLEKPKAELTMEEKDILINYQYCTKLMGEIEDQGDVHLVSNEFDEAKEYYFQKINKNEADAKNYYKLANVQKECGEIDEAEKNGKKSLALMTQKMDMNDRQTCLKVFSIHSKNAQINILKEDYLNADEQLTRGLQLLDDQDDLYEKAKKIRERGEIKFKKGEIKEAQKDFDVSESMFNDIEKIGAKRRWELNKKYVLSFITLWCSPITKEELEERKIKELQQIEQKQKEILSIREQIEQQLIKVNKSLKDVALYVEDKQKYQYCVKKGRAYLLSVQQRETNDPNIKARLKVMEATIQDYLELAESEKLIMDAIALVQSQTPFDPTVGQYSTILAKLQKKELDKYTNPSVGLKLTPGEKLYYNEAQRKGVYKRCKDNFHKAIKILLYNNKTKDSPEIVTLKNQLGQLQFTENNFTSCEQLIAQIKADAGKLQHSQVSKASLLLGKIAFSRGQLKNSFKILDQADEILKKVLIKSKENPKYIIIYQKSDIYLEIVLYRSKVYHRQLHHDLSLKQLSLLETKLEQKMGGYEFHNLLSLVYEQQAEIRANLGQRSFLSCFQKAIQLRKRQMGQYNILNAVTYCNYSKHLMMVNQLKQAEIQLNRAVEIFSCLSNEHPINWVIYFSNGIFNEIKEQYIEADKLFKNSLKMAMKKFDNSHITIKKVRLKIAKILLKLGEIQQSFKQLQELQEQVEQDLNQSRTKIQVLQQIDDEKITLQKIILTELKTVIQKQQNNLRFTQLQIEKYKKKYDDLRRTFRLEGEQKF